MPASFRAEYESLIYTIVERHRNLSASNLSLYTNSATTGFVRGSLYFHNGLELRVFEYLDLTDGEILNYSYTVLRGDTIFCWYDPQPHPDNPDLAPTFPHHRHLPPDIKHNRQIAPGISFRAPNLPTLISDCEALGHTIEPS
jgi:hypothetical protein